MAQKKIVRNWLAQALQSTWKWLPCPCEDSTLKGNVLCILLSPHSSTSVQQWAFGSILTALSPNASAQLRKVLVEDSLQM